MAQNVSSSYVSPLLTMLGLSSISSVVFPPAVSNRSSTMRLLASRAIYNISQQMSSSLDMSRTAYQESSVICSAEYEIGLS